MTCNGNGVLAAAVGKLVALLVLASLASAAQLPRAGQALRNDVYLPTHADALRKLTEGDRQFLQALEGGAASDLQLAFAFEAWHWALAASTPGDAVPVGIQLSEVDRTEAAFQAHVAERWPDRDRSFGRRTESVEYAVLRRLCGLDAEHLALWRERFGALAQDRLADLFALRSAPLPARRLAFAALERELPGTLAALRADLWLFEDELEQGRPRAARTWLERAARQASLLGEGSWDAALERREQMLETLHPRPHVRRPRWTTASEFIPAGGHPLVLPNRSKPKSFARFEGRPGLAFLADERVLVQTTGTCWLLAEDRDDRPFEPWRLAQKLGHPVPGTVVSTGREWQLHPLAADDALFVVTGRADGQYSNLLQRIRPPEGIELPVAVWSLGGEGLFQEGGTHFDLEQVLGPGMWEFQPGPILVEGTLLVQARQWITSDVLGRTRANSPGEAKAWLVALDARTGVPRWKHFLCRGTDLTADFGARFDPTTLIRTPGQALRASTTMVLVGTNLGAALLLELADGRLVSSFANDRREASASGWKDGGRPLAWESPEELHPVLLWAPADGNELLGLSADVDFAARGRAAPAALIPHPPLALGESETFLGGHVREVLVYGRAGARRTLSAHDLTSGARIDSIYFGRDEQPLVGALLTNGQVLFATSGGLYRLDRERELYLELFQALAMESDFAPGGLWSRGDELYLLAMGQLHRFRIP